MSISAVGDPRLRPPPQPPAGEPPAAAPSAPGADAGQPSPFAQLVRGLGHEVERGEAVVHDALASAHGGALDPAQLIALQAGVYRYSEAVDLTSKLVDHATSALKTVVQGQ